MKQARLRVLPSLLIAAVLLPAISWVGFSWDAYNVALESARESVLHRADHLCEHAHNLFQTQELVIDLIDIAARGLSIDEIRRSPSLHQLMKNVEDHYPQLGRLWIFGPDGDQGASSQFFPVPPVRVDDRDYFQALRNGDVTFLTAPHHGKLVDVEMVYLARRLSPRDQFNGIILVSAVVEEVRRFMADLTPEAESAAFLVRVDGTQLIHQPKGVRPMVYEFRSTVMQALAAADEGTFHDVSADDGVERLYAFKRLRGYPVVAVVGLGVRSMLAGWRHQLAVSGLMAGLTAALLIGLTLQAWRWRAFAEKARIEAAIAAKSAEAKIRLSESRFRAAQEAAMEGFLILDPVGDVAGRPVDFRVLCANPVTLAYAAAKADDLASRSLAELFPVTAQPDGIIDRLGRVAATGEAAQFDTQYDDGRLAGWFRIRAVKVGDHVAASLTSITAEVEARRAAERAGEAKAHFFASASHDLRQPLQALRLYVDVLAESQPTGVFGRAVEGARRALDGAEGLLHSLLDVARIEAGTIEFTLGPVRLDGLLDRLAKETGPLADAKGLKLVMRPTTLTVVSDIQALERILRNLITNAIRYTARGGVLIGCRRRGGEAVIEVWDSGEGIPADQLERIWEEFFQLGNAARDRNEGLGLGLSIVRKLALMLGHRVSVASRPGRGTVFRVALALAPAADPG